MHESFHHLCRHMGFCLQLDLPFGANSVVLPLYCSRLPCGYKLHMDFATMQKAV